MQCCASSAVLHVSASEPRLAQHLQASLRMARQCCFKKITIFRLCEGAALYACAFRRVGQILLKHGHGSW